MVHKTYPTVSFLACDCTLIYLGYEIDTIMGNLSRCKDSIENCVTTFLNGLLTLTPRQYSLLASN